MACLKARTWAGTFAALLLAAPSFAGQTLYNGIVLPDPWPPSRHSESDIPAGPVTPDYLVKPPGVIPIDVGRQLFVDDFLIEQSSLKRTFHVPEVYDKFVHPGLSCSGGTWFDPKDGKFKAWNSEGGIGLYISDDGINWQPPLKTNLPSQVSPSLVWLDQQETDPAKRFKLIYTDGNWDYQIRYSGDGITWSGATLVGGAGDRSTAFYNPFRKVWVFSIRLGANGRRARYYYEAPRLEGVKWDKARNVAIPWVGADSADLPHPDINLPTELYNLDCAAYESVMLGFFSIWHGDTRASQMKNPPTDKARLWQQQNRPKLNLIKLGYSRDGWNWDRPDRRPFISYSEDPQAWNYGNVQSVGGGLLVVGDKLYIYFSGRRPGETACDGVAFLRRDGFASLDADEKGASLTTRPVTFGGKHLFVNVDDPKGELRVEVLGEDGNVIAPFTKENCTPVTADKTLLPVAWQGAADLAAVSGKPVRFRFYLTNGSLYAFWVSPDASGASHGYVAAGGPGFTGPIDTVGAAAYDAAKALPSAAAK